MAFSSPDESTMVSLTNQRRAASGLPALAVDSRLGTKARARSKLMGDSHTFSHRIPPDGHTVFNELTAEGYCYVVAAENFAWNTYPDDQATLAAQRSFEASGTHLANILGKAYTRIGVGAYKAADGTHVYTVLFTQPCAGSSTPAPTKAPTARPTVAPTARPSSPPATAASAAAPRVASTPPPSTPPPTVSPQLGVLGETDVAAVPTTGVDAPVPSTPEPLAAVPAIGPRSALQLLLDMVLAVMRMLLAIAGA